MIATDSASRSSRSPNPLPKSSPNAACSSLEPAAAEPEDRPAAADLVDGRRELRGQARVAERVRRDEEAEPGAARHRRDGRERRPALELRVAGVALVGQEVVVDPEVVRAARPRPSARPRGATASRSAGPRTRRRSGRGAGADGPVLRASARWYARPAIAATRCPPPVPAERRAPPSWSGSTSVAARSRSGRRATRTRSSSPR